MADILNSASSPPPLAAPLNLAKMLCPGLARRGQRTESRPMITTSASLNAPPRTDLKFFHGLIGWAGFGPERFCSYSLDSFTADAGLAMATQNLQTISTAHAAFYHPGVVARIGATRDKISQRRWALNSVGGWAEQDFCMFDIPLLEHDKRYAQSRRSLRSSKNFGPKTGLIMRASFSPSAKGPAVRNRSGRHFCIMPGVHRLAKIFFRPVVLCHLRVVISIGGKNS